MSSAAWANPVIDVNNTLLSALRTTDAAPTTGSRDIALVDIAMYDAVNAASGQPYQPYAYGGGAVAGASPDATAYAAGYTMLSELFSAQSATFQTQEQSALSALSLGAGTLATSTTLGSSVARAFYAARAADGSATAQTPYTYGTTLGAYQSTSSATQPLQPSWGKVTPFVITSAAAFVPGPPPAVGSAAWIAAYQQVEALGCATCGTPTDQEIARFWSDVSGTWTPSGHWLEIADNTAADAGLDTLDSARMGAMVGAALADAGIVAWDTKYTYNTWRPITAIHDCTIATCGVAGDPSWQSLWPATNFPGYISGHSTYSSAAAAALAAFYGTDDISFCSQSDPNSGFATTDTRCFTSFTEAADEAGESRIDGGIHFSFENTTGLAVGAEVGTFVADNAFAVDEPPSWAFAGLGCTLLTIVRWKQKKKVVLF